MTFCLLLSFPDVSWVYEKISLKSHPPNLVRRLLLLEKLAAMTCPGLEQEDLSEVDKLVLRVFIWASAMISIMTGNPVDMGDQGVSLQKLLEHGNKVFSRQQELANEIISTIGSARGSGDIL